MVGPCAPARGRRCLRTTAASILPVVLVLALGFTAGCRQAAGRISDLDGVQQLQAQFDRDAGKPRVVLLLSPT